MHSRYANKLKFEVRDWARGILALPNAVIIDTESTGFGPGAEIVSIAVVSPTGETLLDTLIKPVMPIPQDVTDIHGITNGDVEHAELWRDVYPIVGGLLTVNPVVSYNAEFEIRMLEQSNKRYELPPFEWASFDCAMKEYAAFAGQWNAKRNDWKWHKLAAACAAMRVETINAHDAEADALATLGLLKALAAWSPA